MWKMKNFKKRLDKIFSWVFHSPNSKNKKNTLENIFAHNTSSAGYCFQAFLYSAVIIELLKREQNFASDEKLSWMEKVKKENVKKVVPSLLYIHQKADASREDFIVNLDKKPIDDVAEFKDEFMDKLHDVLSEIFDSNKDFEPTTEKERCTFCEYRGICGR